MQGIQNGHCLHPADVVMRERNGHMKRCIVEWCDKDNDIYALKMFDANIIVQARVSELYWPCERCRYYMELSGIV